MKKIYFFVAMLLCSAGVNAQVSHLVISQVYGGGGNASATYQNDFIEIFNPTGSPVNVNGWSVQYQSQGGTTWAVTNLTNVTIPSGKYYLVQEASGGAVGLVLPTADATGTINLAGGAGKVILVNSTIAAPSCADASIIDKIGFGTTSVVCNETANATGPSNNTTSMLRANGGCTDANNNSTDFSIAAVSPRNSSSIAHYCSPSTQALNIVTSNIQAAQFDFNWADGNGSRRAVFIAAASSGTAAPAINTTYTANTVFGSGTQIGATGWYCVYNSSAAHAAATTVTGLSASTTYRIMVCEFNGLPGTETYNIATVTNNPINETTTAGGALTPPVLTAAAGANVDADFDITYPDDGAWRISVSTVKYGAATLTVGTDYSLAPGILTLKPTGGNPALHAAGTQTVVVTAGGYNDASVSQSINFGAANKLGITVQPAAPAINGATLGTQPAVVVQDQYGNTVITSTATINAVVGAGAWTIGGTTNQNAVSGTGVATFTNLSATSATAVTGATIDFTSSGLTHKESNPFNIPAPPSSYTWNGTGTASWATATNWTPNGVPATNDAIVFSGSSAVTITDVPSVNLSSLAITGTGAVTMQSAGTVSVNVGGGSAPQLNIASGASLILDGTNGITVNVLAGSTGTISGAVTEQGGAHRFTAASASGITFNSGAVFTDGVGATGNSFGVSPGATANSVVFGNGSSFVQIGGANPFALTQPASVVVFQAGSLFKIKANITPSVSGRVYANVEYDVPSNTVTASGAVALTLDNLTVTNGTFNMGMTPAGVNLKGNISVASGATLNFAPAVTAAPLNLSGSVAQNINNSGTLTFSALQNVNVNNNVTLNTNVTVNGNLTLTSGKVSLGSNNLTVGGFVSGGSSTSYIRTNGTGKITANNINAEEIVPVGNAKYNPVTIENGSGHNWAISVEDAVVADPGFPTDKAVQVTWNITPSVNPPAAPANITFQFDETSQVGANFTLAESLQAWHRTSFWHAAGSPAAAVGLSGQKKVKVNGLTNFSPYALSNVSGVLPIIIDYFSGVKQSSNHLLNWKVTCYSTPTVTLSLERSTDGRNYSEIYSITATALQCQQPFNYISAQPVPGINYYRLKMTDANGKVSYSGIVALLNKQSGFDIIGISPNPVATYGKAILNVTAAQAGELQVVVTDMNGKKMMAQTETLVAGSKQVEINFSKLSAGAYLVTGYYSDGTSKTVRVLKQ